MGPTPKQGAELTSIAPVFAFASSLIRQGTGYRILGLPALEGWAVVGLLILLGVLVITWFILRRRGRSASEDRFDSSGRPAR